MNCGGNGNGLSITPSSLRSLSQNFFDPSLFLYFGNAVKPPLGGTQETRLGFSSTHLAKAATFALLMARFLLMYLSLFLRSLSAICSPMPQWLRVV